MVIEKEEVVKIECPEYFDAHEMAQYFEELYRSIPYPDHPMMPAREDFKNHTSYGEALDNYENETLGSYHMALRAYKYIKDEIVSAFKKELLKKLEIEKHPKADLLYSMAYERGHSSGFLEIATIASGLAELIRD